MTISMSASPSPIISGSQLTYTIVVTNTGGAAVSNAALSDQINGMSGLILTSTAGTCSQTNNLVKCSAGTMAGGQTWTVTIRGTVTAAAGTTLNNTATTTATKSSQTFTNSVTSATLVNGSTGTGQPDLTVSITAPSSVATGASYTYTVTINNTGTANATGVMAVDTLPVGMTPNSITPSSLFVCSFAAPTVTCSGGAVNAGANATIAINVTAPSTTGTLTDTASVDPNNTIPEASELNNSTSASTDVTTPAPAPTLSISQTDSPDPVASGGKLTYTLKVVNTTSSRATGVVITDGTQGLDAASISATANIGSCTVSAPTVTCSPPKPGQVLQAGQTMTITIVGTVVATAGSTIINTATVNGNIGNTGLTNTTTEKTKVLPGVDLTVTQALTSPVSPAPVRGRGPFSYTITVGNSGLNDAGGVVVRQPLPAGVVYLNSTNTGGFSCAVDSANVLLCSGGTIHGNGTGGTTETITLSLVAPNAMGNISSTVTVDPYNAIAESDESNNTFATTTPVDTGVDLTVSQKSVCLPNDPCSPGAVAPSGVLTYVITVTNNGTQDASSILLRDNLPSGVSFRFANPQDGHNFTCAQANGVVDCSGGNLRGTGTKQGAGALDTQPAQAPDSAVIWIQVFAPATPSTITNQVSVDPNNAIPEIDETNNLSSLSQVVALGGGGGFIDLSIPTLTGAPDPVATSGVLDYTLVVKNQGTDTAFNVVVQDTLPAGSIFRSAADTNTGSGAFSCSQSGGVVTCSGGTVVGANFNTPLGTPGTRTIKIEIFAPTQPGPMVDQATVDPSNQIAEADETNNQAATSNTVAISGGGQYVELAADMSADGQVVPGSAVTYTLTLKNTGTADAFNVEVTDQLPAAATFVSADGKGAFTCSQAGGTVDCTGGYLPAGGTKTIVITVNAPSQASAFPQAANTDITLFNQAMVDPHNLVPEANETNNSTSAQTTVHSKIDLKVDQSGPSNATQSSTTTYTLNVQNTGTDPAYGVHVQDALPVELIVQTITADPANAFSCQVLQNPVNVVDCSGDLAGNSSVKITISVFVTANDGTQFNNQACVDPSNTIVESNEVNNCSTVTTSVGPYVDVSINKKAFDGTVSAGGSDTYTITVANIGTKDADPNTVTVTDDLGAAGLTISGQPMSTNGFTCTVTGNSVSCTNAGAALASGGNAVITINASVPSTATAPITNTAKVTASGDSNSGNDSASATVNVGNPTIDLAIQSVTDAPDPITAGGTLTYTVLATNNGTQGANPVTIRNALQDTTGLTLLDAVGSNGFSCGGLSGNNIDCSGSLPAGGTTTITIRFTVDASAPGSVTLTSTVDPDHAYSADADKTNNSQSQTTSVAKAPCSACIDLVPSIVEGPNPAASGGPVQYQVTIANTGDTDVKTTGGKVPVLAWIHVDSQLTNVTVSASGGNPTAVSCVLGNTLMPLGYPLPPSDPDHTWVCSGELQAGQGALVTINATAPTGPADLGSSVTADPGNAIAESNEANNVAGAATHVNKP